MRYPPAIAVLAIAVLLTFVSPVLGQSGSPPADVTIPDDVYSSGTLDITVMSPSGYAFDRPDASESVSVRVTNPGEDQMDVYFARFGDAGWIDAGKIGSLGPGEEATFDCRLDFSYRGQTNSLGSFGLAGVNGSGYQGNIFTVNVDWSGYERGFGNSLSTIGLIVAFILLVVLVIIVAEVFLKSRKISKDDAFENEYTIKTLFFPAARGRPLGERVADLIVNPFFWLVELACGILMALTILSYSLGGLPAGIGYLAFAIGGISALIAPVLFLVVAWLFDYRERDPFRFMVSMFMWGIMAGLLAFLINNMAIGSVLTLVPGISILIGTVLIAPVVEEIIKGTGLLVVCGHHEMDDTLDGMLYGFAIGMGFALIENWFWFGTHLDVTAAGGLGSWAFLLLYRSLLNSLAHGCFTGATGAVIGYVKVHRFFGGNVHAGFFIGLPVAILMHVAFNSVAVIDSVIEYALGAPVPVFDPVLTLVAVAAFVVLALRFQKRSGGPAVDVAPVPVPGTAGKEK
jgi:protease PrsW